MTSKVKTSRIGPRARLVLVLGDIDALALQFFDIGSDVFLVSKDVMLVGFDIRRDLAGMHQAANRVLVYRILELGLVFI